MNKPNLAQVRHHAPAVAVLLACVLLTIAAFLGEQRHAVDRAALHAAADATEFQHTLQQGIDAYIDLNRNVAAYFTASPSAAGEGGAAAFELYMQSADVLRQNPGMSYIGYIQRDKRPHTIQPAQAAAAPTAALHGDGPDPHFTYPYLLVFPHDARAHRVQGWDFSAVPERWAAMQQARDSGQTVATARHLPIAGVSGIPVIVVFTPIYDRALASSTAAQRRIALRGFVYSIYYVGEMIERVMGSNFRTLFDLEIYDGSVGAANILYDGDNRPHALIRDDDMPVARQAAVDVAGRAWQLIFYPKPIYVDRYHSWNGVAILLFGFAVSGALALMMWNWTRRSQHRWQERTAGLQFDSSFESHPAAVYALDLERRFVNANAQALREFRVAREQLIGKPVDQFVVPEKQRLAAERFDDTVRGNAVSYDSAIVDGEGARIELSVIMIPVKAGSKVVSILGIAQNITARKQAEWRLQESRTMLQLVIDHIPQRVFWKDTNFAYLGCNKAAASDAGLARPEDIVGLTDFDLAWRASAANYRADDMETLASGVAKVNYEEAQQRDDASASWLRTSKVPLTDMHGETIALLGMYEDITERKNMENQLRELAHYDALTGLANRSFFRGHLDRAVARRRRRQAPLALMYFDIDHFKAVNDTYGHEVGDALLRAFAGRVKDTVRELDVFARLGGDEFALLLEDLPDRAAAERVAGKLVLAVRAPFALGARELSVSTSIGIAFLDSDMESGDLIRHADEAMYTAKRAGRDRFALGAASGAEPL